jgi:hypothetical protein
MQSKHTWWVLRWQLLDVASVGLSITEGWGFVDATLIVFVLVLQSINVIVLLKCLSDAPEILVISDTTTVVDLSGDVLESLPWNLVLFKEDAQHRVRCVQVGIVELIGNVETKRTELSSLLNNGMEETNSESKFPPHIWLLERIALLVLVKPVICNFCPRAL